MAQWISDFIGWSLGQTNQYSVHTIDQYIYMGAIIVTIVAVVIVLGEMASLIKHFTGKGS